MEVQSLISAPASKILARKTRGHSFLRKHLLGSVIICFQSRELVALDIDLPDCLVIQLVLMLLLLLSNQMHLQTPFNFCIRAEAAARTNNCLDAATISRLRGLLTCQALAPGAVSEVMSDCSGFDLRYTLDSKLMRCGILSNPRQLHASIHAKKALIASATPSIWMATQF